MIHMPAGIDRIPTHDKGEAHKSSFLHFDYYSLEVPPYRVKSPSVSICELEYTIRITQLDLVAFTRQVGVMDDS